MAIGTFLMKKIYTIESTGTGTDRVLNFIEDGVIVTSMHYGAVNPSVGIHAWMARNDPLKSTKDKVDIQHHIDVLIACRANGIEILSGSYSSEWVRISTADKTMLDQWIERHPEIHNARCIDSTWRKKSPQRKYNPALRKAIQSRRHFCYSDVLTSLGREMTDYNGRKLVRRWYVPDAMGECLINERRTGRSFRRGVVKGMLP